MANPDALPQLLTIDQLTPRAVAARVAGRVPA
jgi:hypothetical protein